MKLTWFGSTAFRIHVGGQIVVVDAQAASAGINAEELVSGADVLVTNFGAELTPIDPIHWKPRKPPRLIDEPSDDLSAVNVWRLREGALLLDATGERPVILLKEYEVPEFGHWAEQAVVVLAGIDLRERTGNMRDATAPHLVMLAGESFEVDDTFETLEDRLFGMGLIALERGMAVEV